MQVQTPGAGWKITPGGKKNIIGMYIVSNPFPGVNPPRFIQLCTLYTAQDHTLDGLIDETDFILPTYLNWMTSRRTLETSRSNELRR
jgi:hypothetical protein